MLTYDQLDLTDRYTLLESLPFYYKTGVEIGVWQGWYTCHIIQKTNMMVYAIDPWKETDSYEDAEVHIDPYTVGPDGFYWQEARYLHTKKTLKESFPPNRWEIFRSYSDDIAKFYFVFDESVDFVYIDGEHTYEAVSNDIKVWWPKIKKGGILAGHDYNDVNPGTIKAVDEFAERNKLKFVITGTNPEKGDAGAPSWAFIKGE